MRPEKHDPAAGKIALRPTTGNDKLVRRTFPGPRGTDVPLRVAIERAAYADLIAHAKESLDAEVCGVLVGQSCEDNEGRFVHIEALIRGSAASQGATHVTFTQATWEAIHATLEKDHPKSKIVGWYHTHPGFGVVFSEMDLFIQKNFFAGPEQIALVTDPLSGAVAIAVNMPDGIEYLSKYWVDAREQPAKVPAPEAPPVSKYPEGNSSSASDLVSKVTTLEARVSQLIQLHDEQRNSYQRFLYSVGFAVCFTVLTGVGYFIYNLYTSKLEPPRLGNYIPIPIQVGDKTVLVGLGVVQWDVPPELNSLMLKMAKSEREEELKRLSAEGKSSSKENEDSHSDAKTPATAQPNSNHKP